MEVWPPLCVDTFDDSLFLKRGLVIFPHKEEENSMAEPEEKVPAGPLYEPRTSLPVWRSCCFSSSPAAATFIVQVLFSGFLILFSAWKLAQTNTADPLWVSLLTTTIGVWLPSPLTHSVTNSFQSTAPDDSTSRARGRT
jgi:hypothetical protein